MVDRRGDKREWREGGMDGDRRRRGGRDGG